MSLSHLRALHLLHELTLEAQELFDMSLSLDSFLIKLASRLDARVTLLWRAPPEGGLQLLGSAGLSRSSRALTLARIRLETLELTPETTWPYRECQSSEPLYFLNLQLGPESSPYGLSLCFGKAPAAYLTGSLRQLGQTLYRMLEHRGLQDRSLHVASRLQTVLAAAPDGILLLNQTGGVLDWNPAAERLLGWPGPSLYQQPVAARLLSHPQDQRLLNDMLVQTDHALLGQWFERNSKREDGSEAVFELSLSPVLLSETPIFALYVRDISERRQIDRRLLETMTRLETLCINLQAGVLLENARREVLLSNPVFCELFGVPVPPEALIGSNCEDSAAAAAALFQDPEAFLAGVARHLERGEQQLGEVLALADGRFYERDFIPIAFEGQRIGQLWVYRDVSAMISAAREREILARFPDENPNPVLRISPDGLVLYANAPAQYLLCYLGNCDLTGTQRLDGEMAELLQSCLSARATVQREILFGRRWYQMNWTPCFDAEVYVNVYATDITERRAAEAEALHARDEALSSSAAKSEFLAMMSHEIRTPLNAVLGMLQMLAQTPLQPEQERYLESSRKAGDNLLALINNLLDFSRLEAGQIELPQDAVDIAGLVADCLSVFELRARRQGLTLSSRLPDGLPLLTGDVQRLGQLLSILIDNALKFTERGEICVELISLTALSATETELYWCVSDTGIGVPADKQALIFERFRQVDSSNTRRYGGSGLGLSIARELVKLFGGRLWLESEPGKGSRFYFTQKIRLADPVVSGPDQRLPAPETPEAPDASEVLAALMRPARILIAEDYEENRFLIKMFLRETPYELFFAHDGFEAIAQSQACRPDLILMDVQMPGLDGLEATERIRALSDRRMPILALTADTQELTRQRCLEAGCDALLTKPIEQSVLLRTLARQLAQHPSNPVPDPSLKTTVSKRVTETDSETDSTAIKVPVIIPEVAELLPLFLELREAEPAAIRQAAADQNFKTLERLGHGLKGVGGSFGFPEISELGSRLETAVDRRDLPEVLSLADELSQDLALIRAEAARQGLL